MYEAFCLSAHKMLTSLDGTAFVLAKFLLLSRFLKIEYIKKVLSDTYFFVAENGNEDEKRMAHIIFNKIYDNTITVDNHKVSSFYFQHVRDTKIHMCFFLD